MISISTRVQVQVTGSGGVENEVDEVGKVAWYSAAAVCMLASG